MSPSLVTGHREDLQIGLLGFQRLRDLRQVPDGACKPVELGHNERVAFANEVESRSELRAFCNGGDLLGKYLLTASLFEISVLSLETGDLVGCRCPCVSHLHVLPPRLTGF